MFSYNVHQQCGIPYTKFSGLNQGHSLFVTPSRMVYVRLLCCSLVSFKGSKVSGTSKAKSDAVVGKCRAS